MSITSWLKYNNFQVSSELVRNVNKCKYMLGNGDIFLILTLLLSHSEKFEICITVVYLVTPSCNIR